MQSHQVRQGDDIAKLLTSATYIQCSTGSDMGHVDVGIIDVNPIGASWLDRVKRVAAWTPHLDRSVPQRS